jgi:hypothetical protein
MRPIQIPALTPEQPAALEELFPTTREARLRTRADGLAGRRAVHDRRADRRDRPRQRGDGAPLAQALPRRRSRGVARCAA